MRTIGAAAGITVLTALGLAAPAHAASPMAEGTFPIELSGCHVSEVIELQGSPAHDYMMWKTTSNSQGCYVSITRNGAIIEEQSNLSAGDHHSDWYYDGPGNTAKVCVSNGDSANCGPSN